MTRPQFRPRVWMLMALVAVAAVVASFFGRLRSPEFHRATAARHGQIETVNAGLARSVQDHREIGIYPMSLIYVYPDGLDMMVDSAWYDGRSFRGDDVPRLEDSFRRRAAYHAEMRRKHEWAARHPWFPVTLDPPEPPLPQ